MRSELNQLWLGMGPGGQILVSALLKELANSAVDIQFAEGQ